MPFAWKPVKRHFGRGLSNVEIILGNCIGSRIGTGGLEQELARETLRRLGHVILRFNFPSTYLTPFSYPLRSLSPSQVMNKQPETKRRTKRPHVHEQQNSK